MHRLKQSENTYKFDILLDKIFDFYCALKISGHPELKNLKIKGKPIFDFEGKPYIKDVIYSIDEINELTQLYLSELIEQENISSKNFFLYGRERVIKFESKFNNIISSTVSKLNGGIISGDLIEGLKTGNYENVNKVIHIVQRNTSAALEAREKREIGLKSLQEARREKLERFREENRGFTRGIKQKVDEVLDYVVPSNDLNSFVDKVVCKLLSEEEGSPRVTDIRTKEDLMKYYNHESGVAPTEENLNLILKKYKQELELMEVFGITPEQKKALIKLAQKSKHEKFIFTNNENLKVYIEDNLKDIIAKANIHMVKLFKDNLK